MRAIRTVRTFVSRLAALARSRRHAREIDEEIASHLEEAAEEYVARGFSREKARLAARRDFGGIVQTKQIHREVRTFTWPDHLRQDAIYAWRRLIKDPAFTAIAVATLTLGIGVNTAIFSVVNGVLLSPLPYPASDRLVAIYAQTAEEPRASSSYPNVLDWVRDNRSFSDVAAYRPDDLNLIGLGQPERVPAEMVSASFFQLLGVQPTLGRTFLATDDHLGAAPVVLISACYLPARRATRVDPMIALRNK